MTAPTSEQLAASARQKALALCAFAETMIKEHPGVGLKAALVAFVASGDQQADVPADLNWDELFLSIVWSAVAQELEIDRENATQDMFDPVYDQVMKALTAWVATMAPEAGIGQEEERGPTQ